VLNLKHSRHALKGMVTELLDISEALDNDKLKKACEVSVAKVAHGDISALSQLYSCLKRPVFLLAYSVVSDYSLAEDVTQETFLRISEKASTYRPGTNPKAWIFTIARNLALTALRGRKCEQLSEEQPLQTGESIEDIAVTDADFSRAIAVLDSDERNIVILKIVASMKHKEIAQIMGISTGDARVRYFRALKKFKSYYEGRNGK
jgi:RNA polymerase sigma factor (sigma-70 family)